MNLEMAYWVTFIYSEGAAVMPLTNDNFQSKLKMALQLAGISTENYSRHSEAGLNMLSCPH